VDRNNPGIVLYQSLGPKRKEEKGTTGWGYQRKLTSSKPKAKRHSEFRKKRRETYKVGKREKGELKTDLPIGIHSTGKGQDREKKREAGRGTFHWGTLKC